MAIKPVDKVFEKHRGMNDLSDLKRIEDDHCSQIINFDYVPAAEGRVHLEMRCGTTKDTMTAALAGATPINGLEVVNYTDGVETIFAHGTKVYKLGTTPTTLLSGVTTGKMFDFAMLEDTLLLSNGTDDMYEKTYGNLPVAYSAAPKAKYLHQWHNYIYAAGMTANKDRVQRCELANKDVWPAGGIEDRPYGEVTGLGSLKDVLYIFYLNAIEQLTGYSSDDFTWDKFADIGCISHFGIVSNGSTIFFPSRDGFWAIGQLGATDQTVGGSSLIKLGSEKIKTFWDTLDLSRDLIHGVHDADNHKIRWSVRRLGQTKNDREIFFDFDPNVLGFGVTEGMDASCYALGTNATTAAHQVKFGSSAAGVIYKIDKNANTDDGDTIEGTIITKAYDFGRPDLPKRFNTFTPLVKGRASQTPIKVSYGVGEFPGFEQDKTITTPALPVYGTAVYGTDLYTQDTFKNYPIAIRRMGESMTVKMECNTASKRARIAGWTINAQVMNKKIKSEV